MDNRLTERQNQAYEFIRRYMQKHRKPPTLKEIGDALGIRSSNGVFKLINVLIRKGYVQRNAGLARGISLTKDEIYDIDSDIPFLPIANRRASSENPERLFTSRQSMNIDPSLIRNAKEENCLLARNGDDGMNRDGMLKGDWLIIEKTPYQELKQDEVAAFLVREQLVVRRFFFGNDRIHLRPSDRSYTEEVFLPETPECYVVGRVLGIIRTIAK